MKCALNSDFLTNHSVGNGFMKHALNSDFLTNHSVGRINFADLRLRVTIRYVFDIRFFNYMFPIYKFRICISKEYCF